MEGGVGGGLDARSRQKWARAAFAGRARDDGPHSREDMPYSECMPRTIVVSPSSSRSDAENQTDASVLGTSRDGMRRVHSLNAWDGQAAPGTASVSTGSLTDLGLAEGHTPRGSDGWQGSPPYAAHLRASHLDAAQAAAADVPSTKSTLSQQRSVVDTLPLSHNAIQGPASPLSPGSRALPIPTSPHVLDNVPASLASSFARSDLEVPLLGYPRQAARSPIRSALWREGGSVHAATAAAAAAARAWPPGTRPALFALGAASCAAWASLVTAGDWLRVLLGEVPPWAEYVRQVPQAALAAVYGAFQLAVVSGLLAGRPRARVSGLFFGPLVTSLLAISALVSVALPPASSPIALAISLSASAAAAASSAVLQVALHRLVPLSGAALWGPVSAGQAAAGAIVPAIGVLAHLSGDIGHRDASAALLLAALALAAAGLLSVPHVLRRLPEMGPVVQAASAWQATLSPEAEAWSAGPAGCQPPDAVDVVDAADAYLAAPADTLDPRERRSASRPPTDAHQAYPPGPGTVASATSSVVEAVETVMTTAICTGMGLAPARPDTPIRDRLSLGAAAALRPGRGSLDDTMASRSAMAAASVAGSPGVAHWHRASATAATPRGYRPGWSLPRPGTAVERRPRSAGRFPADRGPRALASSPPGGISASPQASPELPSVPFAVPSPAVMYAGRQLAFLPHYRPPPRPLPPASITSEGESASFHAPGATTPPRGPSSGGRTPSPGLSVSGDAAAAAVAAAAVSSLTFSAGDGINPGSPGGSGFFTWAKPSGAAGEGASARGVGASVAFQGPGGVDDWANADLEAARAEILQILVPARHRGALAGVAHVVWDDGVAAFLAGAVTWTLFPGVVGSIRPGTWAGAMPDDAFPLLLFAFFGAADVVGRWIPSAMSDCGMRMFTGPVLVAAALVRVPVAALLLVVNVAPPGGWILPDEMGQSDVAASLLVVVLGLSHGTLLSMAFKRAHARAILSNQEAAGAFVSLCASGGLLWGAVTGWIVCLVLQRG